MSRLLVATLVLAGLPWSAQAALEPELQKPYELNVVLHIAEHPLLTPVFRGQVERELHAHLQSTLEGLANVHLLREHPLLSEVEAKGLQQALDNWRMVSDAKTHFVLIDFLNGAYEIQ